MSEPMRVPPNSLDAERAVLGGLLIEPTAIDLVADLPPDDFYGEAHARIFEAMLALFARSQPIDHTTVREELARSQRLAAIGGEEYLFALTSTFPTVAHIEAHATIIRDKASVRRMITACHEIVGKGYGDYGEARAFLAEAEGLVFASASRSDSKGAGPVLLDAGGMIQRIQDVAEGRTKPMGISTSLASLDAFTGGLRPGEVTIVAGRPSMGKSALALGMADAASRETTLPVPVFSLEMPREQLEERFLSMRAGVDSKLIRTAKLSPDDWRSIASAAQEMQQSSIMIDDTAGITPTQLRSRCRRAAAQQGNGRLGAIVIDYLQLMRPSGSKDSREQEVSEISRAMKDLAKELHCPVIVLSQLNRKCEDRPDKRPQLSDLRESGSIEQDADNVILVYRRGFYAAQLAREGAEDDDEPAFGRRKKSTIQPGEDDGKAELIVAKQRAGSPGTVKCRYRGECTRFEDEPAAHHYQDTRARGDWDDE